MSAQAASKVEKPTVKDHANFIDGKMRPAADGRTIDVVCPSDGQVFATIARSGQADVDAAVRAARVAFDTGAWPRTSATDRGRVLARMSELILSERESLARLEAKDVGKIYRSTFSDVTVLARYFEFYAGAADKIGGDVIPLPTGFTAFTIREPLGVVAGILPWNSPTQMFGRVVSPALAMGNTVVLKPAEDACLTVLRLAELAMEAGLPDGALNVVTGYGHEAGAALSAHPAIDFISFTGSPEVGTLVQQAAAANHVGVTLELGGKSPHILFDDADFAAALPIITNSIIVNSGQTCVAGSRLLVQASAIDRVSELFGAHFQSLSTGPHDVECDLGPLINAKQHKRVNSMLSTAIGEGVPVIAEGRIADGSSPAGYFVRPMLLGPVPRQNTIARKEVFGPVLSLLPFTDESDAIALANDTPFGLAAAVWSRDVGRAMRASRQVRAGQVYINGYGAGGGVELPFGGFKKSGHGREKGMEALHEFSATKTVILNHG